MSKLKESKYNEFIILEIEMSSSTATSHPLMTFNHSNPVRGLSLLIPAASDHRGAHTFQCKTSSAARTGLNT